MTKKGGLLLVATIVLIAIAAFVFWPNGTKKDLFLDLTPISVGYLPSLAASPLYVAIAEGYFEQEGLDVRIQEVYSGPELINALQGKAVDVAFGIVPPLIMSRAKGLPIKSIVGATLDSADVKEHRLMLPLDSSIESGKQLKGKKIAVVAEGTSDYFGLLQYLEKHGLKAGDVEIIKTPHPEMIFGIASKSVDAACGIEPFITIGELRGKVKVFDFYYPDNPVEIGTYLAHEDFLSARPEVAQKFSRAIRKGNRFANDHARLRKLLPTLEEHGIKFKISEEAARAVTIMRFQDSLTEKGIRTIMQQLMDFGVLKNPIDVEACIYQSE